jgi:hypothetical protein
LDPEPEPHNFVKNKAEAGPQCGSNPDISGYDGSGSEYTNYHEKTIKEKMRSME